MKMSIINNNLKIFLKIIRQSKLIKFSLHIFFLIWISFMLKRRYYTITEYHFINRYENDFRYILLWSNIPGVEYEGQNEFIRNKCEKNTCYFTQNRTLFNDIRYFDAIVFNVIDLDETKDLPVKRGSFQKYIFVANESADNYPVCHPVYEDFFNWTWTYRRSSTIFYQFVVTVSRDGYKLIGDIRWPETKTLAPTDKTLIRALDSKNKAAAIFLDKCESRSKREVLLKHLESELNKYNLSIDVYGDCGTLNCKKRSMRSCNYRIKRNYYFYLALEDSLDEDYVTDIVLHAYNNNAVPVVYGGAEYINFVPKDSFLDVKNFSMLELAKKMHELITHKEKYHEMFRWKNNFRVEQEFPLDVCALCENLNEPRMLVHKYSWSYFRKWWNPNYKSRCNNTI